MSTVKRRAFNLIKEPSVWLMMEMLIIKLAMALSVNPENAGRDAVISLVCVGFMVGCFFIKERHLYKAAMSIFIAVFLILLFQILSEPAYGTSVFRRWIYIFGVPVKTAALTPLLAIPAAKAITLYKNYGAMRTVFISIPMVCCLALVFMQYNLESVCLMLLVMFIVFAKAVIDRKITPLFILFAVVAVIVATVIILAVNISEIAEFSDRIATIITRGKNDPTGAGFSRTLLDELITGAKFFGTVEIDLDYTDATVAEVFYEHGNHNVAVILAEYGWFTFAVMIIGYGFFIGLMFVMAKGTKQSDFARYTSFILSTVLAAKFAVCLISFILMERVYDELPFMSSMTDTWVECISLGIVLGLYVKRNKPTSIVTVNKPWSLAEEINLFVDETKQDIRKTKGYIKRFFSFLFSNNESSERPKKTVATSSPSVSSSVREEQRNSEQKPAVKVNYVFMSYSSSNKAFADETEKILKKNGVHVWRDSKGIPVGYKFPEALAKAIRGSACFILILTKQAQESQWVPRELERAIHYGKPIIAIKIGDFDLNDNFEMCLSCANYVTVNRIDEKSEEIKSVIKSTKGYVGIN